MVQVQNNNNINTSLTKQTRSSDDLALLVALLQQEPEAAGDMLALRALRIFTLELELDGPPDALSYSSGGVVSGRVVLELRRASPVRSLTALGRGGARAHWLENRTVGMNSVYNDYTSRLLGAGLQPYQLQAD
ncbi:hypothetical protein CRUP_034996 [Coryphaenoides rupestris]|nr:hypothetical protein CRUP_034996 [Coryphaenoides rupestris]